MSTYLPEFAPISELCISYNVRAYTPSRPFATEDFPMPDTPIIRTLPLPSPLPTVLPLHSSDQIGNNNLYPINILFDILPVQELELKKILLTYPIHVHTPRAHIGTIYAASTSHEINAFDLFHFLKSYARAQPNFAQNPAYYDPPTQQMEIEVESAFFGRCGRPLSSFSKAGTFIEGHLAGEYTYDGLMGKDLLLGNVDVWGLERGSVYGYSVVHVA